MIRTFNRLVAFMVFSTVALLVCTGSSSAAMIPTWNVGSGQPQDNFVLDQYPAFPGGALELGQRTIYRQSAMPVPVSGTMYTVYSGYQTAGEFGAPSTNIARNRWNFDYHIYYSGGVQNLDNLFMTITSPTGNTVSALFFDMKVANNDNVTGSQPFPAGDSQDPTFYIQDSQNPVFAPWFVPMFNMDVEGLYAFTLTAVEGQASVSQTMYVNVIPAPGAGALLGLCGLTCVRRRR